MKHIYFAGGGTGGHIYPALAVADELSRADFGELSRATPACKITFFCSQRPIDTRILAGSGFGFVPLPVRGFSKNPYEAFLFLKSFFSAKKMVKQIMLTDNPVDSALRQGSVQASSPREKAVLFSMGGFVSAPAVFAARSLKIPVVMLNIDAVPGKANKLLAHYAKDIFVQFEKTARSFGLNRRKVTTTGCPLRRAFFNPDKNAAITALGLSPEKKVLLVTGASGGAANINSVIGYLLNRLDTFTDDWQIVHLSGLQHFDAVKAFYRQARISHKILDYFDDMPNLLAASDIVIGRAGAMSVAEFAASRVPAICLPYPYHGDEHQRLNARYLVDAGCGTIIDDLCDTERTSRLLWPVLCDLMSSDEKRLKMKANCAKIVNSGAAAQIACKLLNC